jgi:ribosomal protein S18 acetylase RimI-like enzyme
MTTAIRPFRDGDGVSCERLLRALPEWFGIEASLVEYVHDTTRLPSWIAERDRQAIGFITIRMHNPLAAEIHCMAVAPGHHRRGVGAAMVRFVEEHLAARGVQYLQVKTVGPSRPDEFYDRTRRFYEAMGFVRLEEFPTLWPGNPCLLLVKTLDGRIAG